MAFSQLLLVAASSKKYIEGEKGDRLIIGPKSLTNDKIKTSNPDAGEIILCFQLDDRKDQKSAQLIANNLPMTHAATGLFSMLKMILRRKPSVW